MAVKIVDGEKRLSKLEFVADEDWATHPRSMYTCPWCSAQIEFALRDLDRHRGSSFTNLTAADAEHVSAIATRSDRDYNDFIDFYCQGCGRPVRICYTAWAGGRFTYGYKMEFVVEVTS